MIDIKQLQAPNYNRRYSSLRRGETRSIVYIDRGGLAASRRAKIVSPANEISGEKKNRWGSKEKRPKDLPSLPPFLSTVTGASIPR